MTNLFWNNFLFDVGKVQLKDNHQLFDVKNNEIFIDTYIPPGMTTMFWMVEKIIRNGVSLHRFVYISNDTTGKTVCSCVLTHAQNDHKSTNAEDLFRPGEFISNLNLGRGTEAFMLFAFYTLAGFWGILKSAISFDQTECL